MLLVVVVLLGATTVPLLGGRLGALADVRIRQVWALGAGLGLQVLAISVFPAAEAAGRAAHLASYAFVAVFVARNWRLPGMPIVGLGGLLNFVAIAVNGGVMPASPAAVRSAGLTARSSAFENSAVVRNPRLGFLGDVFSVPEGVALANVFSVGDALIALGLILGVHAACGSRLVPRRWRCAGPRCRHTALPIP